MESYHFMTASIMEDESYDYVVLVGCIGCRIIFCYIESS